MKKLYILLIVLLAALSMPAAVTVLSSDAYQSQVEFVLGDYTIREQDSFARISVPHMAYPHLPGAPGLPLEEFKIALPPAGNIVWTLTVLEEEQVSLNHRVMPVPYVSAQESGMSQYHYRVDESLYASASGGYVTELEPDIFRGYSFTSLRVNPFQYDGQRSLRILKRAIINIKISGDVSYKSTVVQDGLAELFLDAVINPAQAQHWKQHFRTSINHAPFSEADYWLKIEVDKNGIYQLTRQNLSSLPLEDVDPRTIRMFSTGGAVNPPAVQTAGPEFKEIPIRVIGEEDGHFDASDKIIFFGENRDGLDKTAELGTLVASTVFNPYSLNGVYWLTFGGSFSTPPLRIQMQDLYSSSNSSTSNHTTSSRYEKESHRIDPYSFEWYSDKLFGMTTADYIFNLDLNDVDPDGLNSIKLTLRHEGAASYDSVSHKIRVWVNEHEIQPPSPGYFGWRGPSYYTLTRNGVNLRDGENTVRIRVLRTKSVNLFLDYIHIVYQQKLKKGSGQFMINGPDSVAETRIAYQMQTSSSGVEVYRIGSSFADVKQVPWQAGADVFISPSNHKTRFVLTQPNEYYSPVSVSLADAQDLTLDTSQVDHIIIAPEEFLEQASTLASMYQEFYDLSVRIVDQADIIDQFTGGHPDPLAIRQYLRYVYKNFTAPQLQGVTLLGTGTIDWRNKSRISTPKNKMMVYMQGATSSDDYYVMMDSKDYPELIVGRYPVRNTTELNTMLSNYRNYVSDPTPGWWRNSMVFLADDLYNGSDPVAESYHTQQMERAANLMHKSVRINKIFGWEYDYDEYQNKPGARDDMIGSINEGVLVWYYVGHGSYDSLGAEDYFNGATDMVRLHNADKLPLFIAAACSVSNYDHWGYDSLGDKLVLQDNYGCIASYAATRRGGGEANTRLVDLMFEEMIGKRHPLGISIMASKLRSNYNSNDLYFVLLGDPTLRINTPIRDSLLTVDGSATSAVLCSRQQSHVEGSFGPYTGNGTASLRLFDSGRNYNLGSNPVSQQGNQLFKGDVSVNNGSYQGGFIVPDDVTNGNTGSVMCYLWDDTTKQDYLNYFYPVNTRDNAVAVENDGPPKIELFLGTMDFRAGDVVPASTTLIAKISDGNGINVTGSSGHHIFLVIDDAAQPIPVTEYFNYNKDSFTEGILRYPLPKLSEGPHTVQLIAFDNFNLPSVANTHFVAKHSSELSIQRLLPYPNPMEDDGYITFILSEEASLDIGIYTVTGKRVKRIKTMGREGFNQIPIDARDNNGNRLANNTYFIKIKAKAASKSTEATERLVIYK